MSAEPVIEGTATEVPASPVSPPQAPPVEAPTNTADQVAQEAKDGVVVWRTTNDKGELVTVVQAVGDIRPTEIQTILQLGLRAFKKDNGLE